MKKIICPLCQVYVIRATIIALDKEIYICPECDAVWWTSEHISFPNGFDFGTVMESYGLPYTWDQLKQDPEYPSANDVEEPFRWVKTPYDQSAMCVLGPLDIGSRSTHIDELEVVSQELKSWKFPFLDCCLIHSLSGVADNNFNPELASYFICVWARCIRVRSLPSYSPAWITEEYQKLDMEILQRLSNQAQLLAFVSEEQTPQLYKHIRAIEELRKKYLIILRMYLDKSF